MTAFDEVVSIITSEAFQKINSWERFEMSAIKNSTPLESTINGIYALAHPRYGVIYIGKGKPIITRIKCHYRATLGKESSPAWKQFFETINSDIGVYWYSVDHPDQQVAEQMRDALEKMLQIKYRPLFDVIFPRGRRKHCNNFEEFIK